MHRNYLFTVVLLLVAVACTDERASLSLDGAGPAAPKAQEDSADASIRPFNINVPDSLLTDLQDRLSRARFPDEINGAGWDYGTNTAYLKELVAYWRDGFDWRAQEQRLNQFAQFKTNIDGLDIHFIHERSSAPNALPLILLNGWPSSIDEYSKVIHALTDPTSDDGRAEDAFHVIVPAMPGYGFSDKPRERGYGPEQVADAYTQLMARLGYTRYVIQGSDWGVYTGTRLALRDKAHVAALHLTGCPATPPPDEARPFAGTSQGSGYYEIQTTRPQTLGVGLSDSPVGLASWIVDKFHAWPDNDGDIERMYTKDQLLTNIMIYWVTNSGTSSTRMYFESRNPDGQFQRNFVTGLSPTERVETPTGCALFGASAIPGPDSPRRRWTERSYNVVHWAQISTGGHFHAFEVPELWVDEVRTFFGTIR